MRDVNSLNKVMLIGRLGQRPEIRLLPQGDRSIARFTMATNERSFNPQTNQATIKTEWHQLVAWGKLAEFCERFLEQGKQILVEGKLRTRSWQDRDGNKRKSTEIEAYSIVLLGPREPQQTRGNDLDAPYRESGQDAPYRDSGQDAPFRDSGQDTTHPDFPANEDPAGPVGDDEVPF